MVKRKLLLSHQYNYRGIKSYESLLLLQAREDLKVHFNDQNVDILPWAELDSNVVLSVYDTVVLMEFPFAPKFNSKHRKHLRQFLKKFSGLKYSLYRDPSAQVTSSVDFKRLLKDYYKHEITADVEALQTTKMEVVYGNDPSLALWTPYTRLELKADFNFPLYDGYNKATFWFDCYSFSQKAHLYTLVDNLAYRISSVPAPYKVFVMPCSQNGLYTEEFISYLTQEITSRVNEVQQLVPEKGVEKLWQYHIWDYDKNELKGDTCFELIN